jgi:hypothetical protein
MNLIYKWLITCSRDEQAERFTFTYLLLLGLIAAIDDDALETIQVTLN